MKTTHKYTKRESTDTHQEPFVAILLWALLFFEESVVSLFFVISWPSDTHIFNLVDFISLKPFSSTVP